MGVTPKRDVDIHYGSELRDVKAAEQSCDIDAAADRQWIEENPTEKVQVERLAIKGAAHGICPGKEIEFCGMDGKILQVYFY